MYRTQYQPKQGLLDIMCVVEGKLCSLTKRKRAAHCAACWNILVANLADANANASCCLQRAGSKQNAAHIVLIVKNTVLSTRFPAYC